MPTIVPAAATRRTETPNAVMTTFASPTLGPTAELALWRVEMEEGARGPLHVMESEQIWTVVAGGARITVAGETVAVASGDTVVVPGGVERQIAADGPFTALVAGRGGAQVTVPGQQGRRTPPWIA